MILLISHIKHFLISKYVMGKITKFSGLIEAIKGKKEAYEKLRHILFYCTLHYFFTEGSFGATMCWEAQFVPFFPIKFTHFVPLTSFANNKVFF